MDQPRCSEASILAALVAQRLERAAFTQQTGIEIRDDGRLQLNIGYAVKNELQRGDDTL